MVKPVFSKKLNSYVKKLTHIEYKRLTKEKSFKTVITNFISWCNADEETVFLSWSDTDLHVLVENYKEVLAQDKVDFITNYTDLQKYVMNFIKTENNNQISLKSAAEFYKINTENFSMHRAEDDSRVCGVILKNCYDKEVFKNYIRNVLTGNFYKKLLFKPYFITDLKDEGIDKDKLFFECPVCNTKQKFHGKYNPKSKSFSNIIKCSNCKKKIAVSFRFKRTFEKITVDKRSKEYIKKRKADKNSV